MLSSGFFTVSQVFNYEYTFNIHELLINIVSVFINLSSFGFGSIAAVAPTRSPFVALFKREKREPKGTFEGLINPRRLK